MDAGGRRRPGRRHLRREKGTNIADGRPPQAAARSVTETLKTWRFHSIEEIRHNCVIENCEKCICIGPLAFRFAIRNGKGVAVDLADEDNRRLRRPNVFEKKLP